MIRWNMTGPLDITSEPSDLASEVSGKNEVSGSLTRCTNLSLDRLGMAQLRAGSSKVSETAHADTPVTRIIPMGGSAFTFAGQSIYEDITTELLGSLTDAPWFGVVSNAYNDTAEQIFATNGTDKKRVVSGQVHEWGIDEPASVLTFLEDVDYVYTYDWEWTFLQEAKDGATGSYDADDEAVYHFNNDLTDDTGNGNSLTNDGTSFSSSTYKFGTHSVYFDGASKIDFDDATALDFSGGIWTIDFWIYPDEVLNLDYLFDFRGASAKYMNIRISAQVLVFNLSGTGGSGFASMTGGVLNTGSWHHIAITQNGSNFYLFVNGVLVDTDSDAVVSPSWSVGGAIGGRVDDTLHMEGYIDEFRVMIGTARWTANFTPPSVEYPPPATARAESAAKITEEYDDTDDYFFDWEEGILDDSLDPRVDLEDERASYWWETGDDFGGSTYGFVYTYARKDGDTIICESNPSDATYADSVNSGLLLTLPQPNDPQVTHIRVYRTIADGEDLYYYVDEVAVGIETLTIRPSGDDGLGSEVEFDHDRIPDDVRSVFGPDYNGYLFALVDNRVYFSKPKQPEYWPSTYYVEVGTPDDEAYAGCFYEGKVYVFTRDKAYEVTGTGYQSFFPIPIQGAVGALAQNGIIPVKGLGIFHTHNDGVWLLSSVNDQKWTKERFDSIFNALVTSDSNIPEIDSDNVDNCLMVYWKGHVYFGYPADGSTYADNILKINVDTAQVEHYDYSIGFTAIAMDSENDRLLAADTSGYLWVLEDTSVTTDGGTDIDWQIQSKDYSDQLRKYFPRAAKWDVGLGSGSTGAAYILLDGSSIQTHTMIEGTTDRAVRKRLIDGNNGSRIALRISGTGPVDIYHAEVE